MVFDVAYFIFQNIVFTSETFFGTRLGSLVLVIYDNIIYDNIIQ